MTCHKCGHAANEHAHVNGTCLRVLDAYDPEFCPCRSFCPVPAPVAPLLARRPIGLAPYGQSVAVVCDDGTAFYYSATRWIQLPPVPQV